MSFMIGFALARKEDPELSRSFGSGEDDGYREGKRPLERQRLLLSDSFPPIAAERVRNQSGMLVASYSKPTYLQPPSWQKSSWCM